MEPIRNLTDTDSLLCGPEFDAVVAAVVAEAQAEQVVEFEARRIAA